MSIQKRFTGKGEKKFLVRLLVNGQHIGRTFDEKSEAKEWETRELTKRYEYKNFQTNRNITFQEAADEFLASREGKASHRDYQIMLTDICKKLGKLKMVQLATYHIENFKNQKLKEISDRGKPFSPARVNRYLAVISAICNKAQTLKYISANPFIGIKKNSEPLENERFLSKQELLLLMEKASDWIKPIIEFAILTGLRAGNIRGLRWDWIVMERGVINLPAKDNKSRKQKHVYLTPRALALLKKLPKNGDYVFHNDDGTMLSANGKFRTQFDLAVKAAGIPKLRFHDLRHTFASHVAMMGKDLQVVQNQLGHSDSKTTARYAHLIESHIQTAIEPLDSLFISPRSVQELEEELRKVKEELAQKMHKLESFGKKYRRK